MDSRLDQTLILLKSIDATMKELLALSKTTAITAVLANDADLDGPRGNPVIKAKDPRDWTLQPMTGRKLSECPATYLDLLAERYDFFNQKETDPQKRKYNALDAARARGWAARIRAGYKPTEAAAADGFPSDMVKSDDISF